MNILMNEVRVCVSHEKTLPCVVNSVIMSLLADNLTDADQYRKAEILYDINQNGMMVLDTFQS